ncbi:MAG: hypothetical protein M0D57_18800 [Sphingobacteriales bacterium JAD_PAG50586_3]|nr:MAG: hypothetical protein M0D57_18800 [Sphingobacteriales bacterium JAD_PAG50586_3]
MRTIKTYHALILASALTILLFSCRDLRTINRDFDAKPISFDLPAIPVSGPFDFTQRSPINLKSQIEAIKIPLVTLKGFAAKEVVVELQDTTGGQPVTFDVLDNVYIYVSTDSLPEALIAFKDPVPQANSTTLTMDTNTDINLLPYAKSDHIIYRVRGQSNKATTKPIRMSIKIKWRVTAEIL